jgi:hypothetical protein
MSSGSTTALLEAASGDAVIDLMDFDFTGIDLSSTDLTGTDSASSSDCASKAGKAFSILSSTIINLNFTRSNHKHLSNFLHSL